MTEIFISNRLKTVASYVKKDDVVADIGSDHAYLPCYLIEQNITNTAIAGEVADGPYVSAYNKVRECNFQDKITVRKGDGLDVISEGEVDCITIAGMGGALIVKILSAGINKLNDVSRLILQPNVGARLIREWLVSNGWQLIAEEIIEENNKIYEILVAEKGNPYEFYSDKIESDLMFGPFLKRDKPAPFKKKWQYELQKLNNVLAQLKHASEVNEIVTKSRYLQKEIALIEEVLTDEKN